MSTAQVSVSRILKDLSFEIVSRDNPVSSNSKPLSVFLDNMSSFCNLFSLLENLNTEREKSLNVPTKVKISKKKLYFFFSKPL